MTRREYGKQKNDNKLDIINSMEETYSLQCKNSCDTISKRNFLTENKDGTVKKGNCT